MVAPSQALEFVLSYGIDLHSLPMTFCTHHILYLTTLQCLLQLATHPKALNGAILTIIYGLMSRRDGQLLHVSALQPSPSKLCKVKSVFERVKASLLGIVSVLYFRSEYTLTTNLSLQLGGMDIALDRTIVLQHCICILFASLGLWGLVLAFIGSKGFWCSLMLRCPFNMYRNSCLSSP